MKKLQSYLMRPQELRKKLENPRFRQDFRQWSKSNLSVHREQSRHSRSKSPVDKIQRSLQLNNRRTNNKENIRPQSTLRQHSTSKSHTRSLSKPIGQDKKSDLQGKRTSSGTLWGRHGCQRERHYESLNNKNRYNSCTSIDGHRRQKSGVVTEDKKRLRQRYSYRTKQGVQINNPNKVNQDSLVIKTSLADKGINLYAVADGHGAYGHLVSQYIVKNLSKTYQSELNSASLHDGVITKVYHKIQKGLTDSDINASCSGSTLVNVMIEGDEIVCANVGDSRAILARQIEKKSWELIYLSQDHKPSIDSERKRVLKYGGRVHAFKDETGQAVGPLRVWLPNQNIQGLAMSRSFGDNVSKLVGVTSEPQIIRMKIDKRDKFVLLASDGVWEFVSNQEVLQLIVPYYKEGKLEEACDALMRLSYDRWTVEDNSVVDDITFVLVFFE